MSTPGSPSASYLDWMAGPSTRVRREPLTIHREDDRPLVWTVLGADGAAVDVSRLAVRAEVRGPGAVVVQAWSTEDGTVLIEGAAVVLLTEDSASWAWRTGQFALVVGNDVVVTCPAALEPAAVTITATGSTSSERVPGRASRPNEALHCSAARRGVPRRRARAASGVDAAAARGMRGDPEARARAVLGLGPHQTPGGDA